MLGILPRRMLRRMPRKVLGRMLEIVLENAWENAWANAPENVRKMLRRILGPLLETREVPCSSQDFSPQSPPPPHPIWFALSLIFVFSFSRPKSSLDRIFLAPRVQRVLLHLQGETSKGTRSAPVHLLTLNKRQEITERQERRPQGCTTEDRKETRKVR